ncbi:hypothetical protein [Amycolatopsis sp. NPDC004169]|uniref:hypothetical protein n=1 Tax=Amycolatopsis sp. NPDC004169 TaxID=3154453 RepID=UPI0033BA8E17
MSTLPWGAWLFLVVLILGWTASVVLLLVHKILAAPERNIRVRISVVPWPRIEIETRR